MYSLVNFKPEANDIKVHPLEPYLYLLIHPIVKSNEILKIRLLEDKRGNCRKFMAVVLEIGMGIQTHMARNCCIGSIIALENRI